MLRGNINRRQIKMVYYPAFHISKIDQNFEAKDLDQVNSMYLELQHVGWNLGKLEFTESTLTSYVNIKRFIIIVYQGQQDGAEKLL